MKFRYSAFILVLLIAAAAAVQPAAAQTSITSDDLTGIIGESVSLSTFMSTDAQLQAVVDADGADQTWDFSQAALSDTLHASMTYYGSGDDLPGGDEFPEANYAAELVMGVESSDLDSTAWIFSQIKPDSLLMLGGSFMTEDPETEELDTLTLAYDPPQLDFLMPLTYGTDWTHASTFFGIETTTNAEVDGWGTIVLPNGSSYDALRVRREETTSAFGFEETTTYIDIVTASPVVSAHLTLAEDNSTFASAEVTVNRVPTAVEDDELPHSARLRQNYPNPFNPSTSVEYELQAAQHVTLTVHDMLGRRVAVLVDGMRGAGAHEVAFDAADLPSGTYIYRLRTEAGTQARVMTLAK